jgi:signal transduction histidine kinase
VILKKCLKQLDSSGSLTSMSDQPIVETSDMLITTEPQTHRSVPELEVKVQRPLYKVECSEPLDQDTSSRLVDLNITLRGVRSVGLLADKLNDLHIPIDGVTPLNIITEAAQISTQVNELTEDLRQLSHAPNEEKPNDKKPQLDRGALRDKIQQQIEATTNNYEGDYPKVTESIAHLTPLQISLASDQLSVTMHELIRPANKLELLTDTHYSEPMLTKTGFREDRQAFTDAIAELVDVSETLLEPLVEGFPHENLQPEKVREIIEETAREFKSQGLTTTVVLDPDVAGRIDFSGNFLRRLVRNIASNSLKSYHTLGDSRPKELNIAIKKDENNFAIILDDNGKGYDQDLIKDGFQKGRSSWELDGAVSDAPEKTPGEPPTGSGIGMYEHTRLAEEEYKAKVKIENRTNDDGTTLGARTTIKIPIAS